LTVDFPLSVFSSDITKARVGYAKFVFDGTGAGTQWKASTWQNHLLTGMKGITADNFKIKKTFLVLNSGFLTV
jgi:hypothetical protein